MKLWVDDERPVPDASWTLAQSFAEARELLVNTRPIEWVSLDYTLSHRTSENGGDVLDWMIENNLLPEVLTVHSSSWAGRELLIEIAKSAGITAKVFVPEVSET